MQNHQKFKLFIGRIYSSNNLSVIAGETLTFAFEKSSGQTFGSLDGLNVDITFISAIPEPETYAMLLAGLGLLVVSH
jgi:hypothetical protein